MLSKIKAQAQRISVSVMVSGGAIRRERSLNKNQSVITPASKQRSITALLKAKLGILYSRSASRDALLSPKNSLTASIGPTPSTARTGTTRKVAIFQARPKMEETMMDLRAKTLIASFVALLGLLGLTAYASLNHAETNADLAQALFGTIH